MAKNFTSDNFEAEVLKSDKPVLVDFYADWCGPCKMMAPLVDQLAQEYEGKAVVGKLNIDENMEISSRYGIMSVPTLMLFKGGEAKVTLAGVQNKARLVEVIEGDL